MLQTFHILFILVLKMNKILRYFLNMKTRKEQF